MLFLSRDADGTYGLSESLKPPNYDRETGVYTTLGQGMLRFDTPPYGMAMLPGECVPVTLMDWEGGEVEL